MTVFLHFLTSGFIYFNLAYRNPTQTDDLPVKWEPSSKENMKFLHIDQELKMGSIPNPEANQLWKNIYEKYRKKNKPNDFKR